MNTERESFILLQVCLGTLHQRDLWAYQGSELDVVLTDKTMDVEYHIKRHAFDQQVVSHSLFVIRVIDQMGRQTRCIHWKTA